MTTAEVFAPAKINLTLHVTGRRADGYHLLDSLVAFANVGDRLRLTSGADLSLSVTGLFARGVPEDGRNLVWRAAEGAGWRGQIDLEKNLPHGAGIGGGSSDAAALLTALQGQGVPVPADLLLSLGADVPVCMAARAARMQGIGEEIIPVSLPKLPALLVNPGVEVPTGAVFSALEERENTAMPADMPLFDGVEDCAEWLAAQRNDLEPAALTVAPLIERALGDLRSSRDALMARMSGSGATCFALYPSLKAAHFAAYEIGAEHPDWWCVATELG
ncbi:4-(cytidine 5'-diphospho)-2-C-methyl-D-erythritol kinase [Tritonibacter scottomollicae]|uniref:4-diphosphocytidyl-2-C-methyl-D-erythritol kinase n=1 Tax=Tritonibacter scottomollicae TaxID=483013 RepID=A0ABZ0HCQ2_TRISK|nr:4-(cytidine 5'-diphospho)-2-C-methyl-D-erythritol kinase [Tritonibacter scottomollicae]WOI31864.1 4-(cytidine 5'-diphospho)-2-C-methyl-D-erythritol kinase [Tritonibacter scottomollicae]